MTATAPPSGPSAWASLVGSTVLFAASYSVTKVALVDLEPLTLGLVRFALAALVLFVVLRGRVTRPSGADARHLGAAGLLGVTAYFALENIGVNLATATDASLLVASYPAISAALVAVTTGVAPRARELVGFAVTAVGVVAIVGGGGVMGAWSVARVVGDGLLLLAGVAWAGYTLLAQRTGGGRSALESVAWHDLAGAVGFVLLAAIEVPRWHRPSAPMATSVAVVVLVVGCSIGAMVLYNHALVGISGTTAVATLNLVPVWGVAIAVAFLDEHLAVIQVVGGVVVLAGVALAARATSSGTVGAASRSKEPVS